MYRLVVALLLHRQQGSCAPKMGSIQVLVQWRTVLHVFFVHLVLGKAFDWTQRHRKALVQRSRHRGVLSQVSLQHSQCFATGGLLQCFLSQGGVRNVQVRRYLRKMLGRFRKQRLVSRSALRCCGRCAGRPRRAAVLVRNFNILLCQHALIDARKRDQVIISERRISSLKFAVIGLTIILLLLLVDPHFIVVLPQHQFQILLCLRPIQRAAGNVVLFGPAAQILEQHRARLQGRVVLLHHTPRTSGDLLTRQDACLRFVPHEIIRVRGILILAKCVVNFAKRVCLDLVNSGNVLKVFKLQQLLADTVLHEGYDNGRMFFLLDNGGNLLFVQVVDEDEWDAKGIHNYAHGGVCHPALMSGVVALKSNICSNVMFIVQLFAIERCEYNLTDAWINDKQ
mmetsp:Transcript_46223/g.86237  ORF Transcript_46223/g.86237 Transcript_46223/m.86237 type:complete len:396 (+) Transcript_46223:1264-2451(+)